MPGFKLPARLRNLGRSKPTKTTRSDKGKEPAKEVTPTPNNSLDIDNKDFELDPSDFNPFDQPDMTLTPDGRLSTKSFLDPYSIVESDPRQTLSDYLKKSDLKRAKTLKASRESPASSTRIRRRGSGSFQKVPIDRVSKLKEETAEEPLHQRVHDLRTEDKNLGTQVLRESRPKSFNGKPAPSFQRTAGYKVPRRGEESYPRPQPLKVIRPKPSLLPLREEQEHIVSPSFNKPVSSLAKKSQEQLLRTAQQILEPPTRTVDVPISLDEALNSPTRPPMPKSPDSGISGMGNGSQVEAEGKGKATDVDSQVSYAHSTHLESDPADHEKSPTEKLERSRPRRRNQRSKSCPINHSSSGPTLGRRPFRHSLDDPRINRQPSRERMLPRGRGSFRHLLDQPRIRRQTSRERMASNDGYLRLYLRKNVGPELEDGGKLAQIYENQDRLRETILDNHWDKIIGELGRRPTPETIADLTRYDQSTGVPRSWVLRQFRDPQDPRKWDLRELPVRIHDFHNLKHVSAVRWTPETEVTMSGAVAVVEDAGGVKLTLAEKVKTKWNKYSRKQDDDPLVSNCPTAEANKELCLERRLKRKLGLQRAGIC
ncbi:uncharacterized protein PAC_12680 [Phialocephala subalpina]|uniref:Uncharacterized protein n=1 Tax=Phialocephala subalpina TaxID=576137 RepID=A0A1L7XCP1_9HELO|nr:uncharacterized protein PAC_12680 [Phialocephala subalpina]